MTLGQAIKKHREGKGWTKEEFAEKAAVSTMSVGKWESGHREPPAKRVNKLSKVLGVDLSKYSANDTQKRPYTQDTVFLCGKWYSEGMSVEDIAEIMDRTVADVRKAITISRKGEC